jgi:DNA-binding XRE family transcriptional regulator
MPASKPNRAPERGHRVAQARHRAGLTQPQLAARVGVSRPTIARCEGGHTPGVTIALAIARELGESAESLFGVAHCYGCGEQVQADPAPHATDGAVLAVPLCGDCMERPRAEVADLHLKRVGGGR